MDLWRSALNACVLVIVAVSFVQSVEGKMQESDTRSSDEKLNRSRREEEDTFNYTGLWISVGIFLAFDGMIVAFGIYKSYFGEIHMPVRREELAAKVQNGKATKNKVGEEEVTAVNPTFIDDEGNHAASQTDFPTTETNSPEESKKVEGAEKSEKFEGAKDSEKVQSATSNEHLHIIDCATEVPVIYTV